MLARALEPARGAPLQKDMTRKEVVVRQGASGCAPRGATVTSRAAQALLERARYKGGRYFQSRLKKDS